MKFARTPLLTLVFAFGLATSARATDQTSHEKAAACDGFAWPVSNERAWFAAKTSEAQRLGRAARPYRPGGRPEARAQRQGPVFSAAAKPASAWPLQRRSHVLRRPAPRTLSGDHLPQRLDRRVRERQSSCRRRIERGAELPGRAPERALRPCARRSRSRSDQRRADALDQGRLRTSPLNFRPPPIASAAAWRREPHDAASANILRVAYKCSFVEVTFA